MLPTGRTFGRSDDRQRVLDATDLVRLIGDHLALKPKGREFVSLCPFHDDHKPSMCVVPHKQIYHCFSCGAGGNAITFVMEYHKMSYGEALKYLAERAGIELTPWRPQRAAFTGASGEDNAEADETTSRGAMLGASATAQGFFRAILNHPEHGAAARAIIEKRGISPEMAELFQLGAAPDKWDGLLLTINAKGLAMEPFRAAGLVKARDSGGYFDMFRNRVMFPIHDQIGRVIAFGGRRINEEEEPKYINSSESAIFDKSSTLYGLHQAAQGIRQTRIAIITEGYMDTIACHQAGVRNAVATLGTAMTAGNAKVLRRLCDTVVLLFDGDEAGQKAAERAVEVFFAEPVDVRIATLAAVTDAKDPDELLKREGGRAIFDQVIARAIDPLELLFSRIRAQIGAGGGGVSARARIVEEFVARLVDLGLDRVDKVRYQLIVKRLSQIADVDWETISGAIAARRARVGGAARFGAATPSAEVEPNALGPGEHLLGCILNDPSLPLSLVEDDSELIDPETFEDPGFRAVASAISNLIIDEHTPSLAQVLAATEEPGVQRAATRLAAEVERLTDGAPDKLARLRQSRLADARSLRKRSTQTTYSPASSDAPGQESLADRVARIRAQRAQSPDDPRAIPRPV
ncbi:MAG TPA: DNA primase [Phycisphaerales bacterium]|nr:DNA primase [Phycisphaerales bacterium]